MTREEAIEVLEHNCPSACFTDLFEAVVIAIQALSAEPEIIRCNDCEHWDKTWTNDWSPEYHYCPVIDGVRKNDFFCADAERRTDD